MLLAGFSVGGIFAASTGNSAILQQNGRGAALQDGDYATESGWVHRFFIEAPSGGLTRLRVQLFDADIGRGSFGGSYDYQAGDRGTPHARIPCTIQAGPRWRRSPEIRATALTMTG